MKSMKPITNVEVIAAAQSAVYQATNRLKSDENELDRRGYDQYATAINNMNVKIERALLELVDELSDKE